MFLHKPALGCGEVAPTRKTAVQQSIVDMLPVRPADFIAALAACATASDGVLINDLVIEDYADVGLYGIKFYVMGKWVTVAIDDRFPCVQERGQWKPLFAGPSRHSEAEAGEKEIWPMLFEKAFAKLNCSYECTDAGMSEDALQYLTGGVIDYLSLTGADAEFERLRTELSDVSGDGFVCCGCRSTREGFTAARLREVGLYSGHAYALTRAVETRAGVRLVQVGQPSAAILGSANRGTVTSSSIHR